MRGNADADQYSRTGLSIGTGVVSMCGWCYMSTDRNDWQTPFGLGGGLSNGDYLYIGPIPNATSNNFGLYGDDASGGDSNVGSFSMTAGNWYFWGLTRSGSTANIYFRAAPDNTLSSDSETNSNYGANITQLIVFDNIYTAEWWDGRANAIKVWDGVALSADEMLLESYFYMPMTNLSSIIGATDGMVLPLIHADDDTVDYGGNGNSLTAAGTPTTEDGPPIMWAPISLNIGVPSVAPAGAIAAALPVVFGVAADLKAQGKLDAALATVYGITADLKAQGKLNATLGFAINVAADLKAKGKLDAALAIVFGVAADLKADGKLDASLAIIFNVAADLKAQGKLDAALAIVFGVAANLTDASLAGPIDAALPISFGVVADLKAKGKLDAALPLVFGVAADLKAKGKLDAAVALVFGVAADLKAQGKLEAALALVFGIAADLRADGKLDATLPIIFGVIADLKAQGKLDAALPLVFGVTADLQDATSGAIDAVLPIVFGLTATLTDATPVVSEEVHPPGTAKRTAAIKIQEDDELILAVIMAFLQIKDDRWH